jgi:hypothetical protein
MPRGPKPASAQGDRPGDFERYFYVLSTARHRLGVDRGLAVNGAASNICGFAPSASRMETCAATGRGDGSTILAVSSGRKLCTRRRRSCRC